MIPEILRQHDAQFFVIYASSKNANFFYATGFKIPDPAFYMIGDDGTDLLVVHEMEKRRAERESKVKEIASLKDLGFYEILEERKNPSEALCQTLFELIRTHGGRKILVPYDFPSFLSFYFRERMDVEVIENPFSKLRAVKRREEVKEIKKTSDAVIKSFEHALKLLRKAKSCEEVRNEIELFLFKAGFIAEETIVSSGMLSADPHDIGRGRIEDHVIIDIFPKNKESGYYSDFTRTVLLEKNPEIEDMLEAVIEAKNAAISKIRDGIIAKEIHHTVCDILEERGYKTIKSKSGEGFIHSTGHGVGLEVHEEPRIFENEDVIKKGMVFTVEPGLYYRKVGGVRVEDTVVVKANECEVLTKYDDWVKL
ncbi:aminopeptidase P family protein [Archaeoglobales archaeon]|nr:MAG: aminopeptidase P family protein [Archaeoglobales archaeon]